MNRPKSFSGFWGKTGAEQFLLPKEFPRIEGPLDWALDVCKNDKLLAATAMCWVFSDQEDSNDTMIYVSRGDATPEIRSKLIAGVRNNASVQLQVMALLRKIRFLREYFEKTNRDTLDALYPFGYRTGSDLFVTGAEHTYDAHCDFGDTILIQLHGKKRFKCWGPSEKFYDRVVYDYDHRGKPELFEGKTNEFLLEPGQAIYFQRGMMHEVSVLDGDQSVSISICPLFTYPVLEVVRDLCRMAGEEAAFDLPEDWKHWDKFRCKVFNPSDFKDSLSTPEGQKQMPKPLKSTILGKLRGTKEDLHARREEFLDRWWQDFCRRRDYCPTGPSPKKPADRIEQLKAWEKERKSL